MPFGLRVFGSWRVASSKATKNLTPLFSVLVLKLQQTKVEQAGLGCVFCPSLLLLRSILATTRCCSRVALPSPPFSLLCCVRTVPFLCLALGSTPLVTSMLLAQHNLSVLLTADSQIVAGIQWIKFISHFGPIWPFFNSASCPR